jgi:F-type H+-transporting ATPase subunit b
VTIDWWTLGFQAVNVLILIWLLGRFFWRPVAAMIAQRRDAARKILADAEAKRAEAAAALAEITRTRAGFAHERDAILKAAQETAEQAHAARLRDAAREAAALEAAAKAAIARDQQAAEKVWAERASHLAVDIARRLAARLDGPAVAGAFLDWLLKEIRNLPDAARQAVATSGATLEASTASVLAPADQQRYGKPIGEAFGASLPVVFKVDPDLIAGLEPRGPHLVVANSWRADLSQILADIAHDNRS